MRLDAAAAVEVVGQEKTRCRRSGVRMPDQKRKVYPQMDIPKVIERERARARMLNK